jgi:glycosyltransferase involved in cell wall biosynthesis
MGRILYLLPDVPSPKGGVRASYRHVEMLVRHGFDAYVCHTDPDYAPPWFPAHVPRLGSPDQLSVARDDCVVFAETNPSMALVKNTRCRKFVFCQNHFYVFQSLGDARSWREYGVERVFCSSHVIADFLARYLDWPDAAVIPYAIDGRLYRRAERRLRILSMPRKLRAELDFVRDVLRRMKGGSYDITWRRINGKDEETTARAFCECAIFASGSHLEGFGLPPLEAMAAGTIVVGFLGDGGREYARPDNGYWVDDMDLVGFADRLAHVIDLFRANDPEIERVRRNGLATAAAYPMRRVEERLIAFWSDVLGRDNPLTAAARRDDAAVLADGPDWITTAPIVEEN